MAIPTSNIIDARWRDERRCIISGFLSPVANKGLRLVLRGQQPAVICLGRSLENMCLPSDWETPLAHNPLLNLSCFTSNHDRATAAMNSRHGRR